MRHAAALLLAVLIAASVLGPLLYTVSPDALDLSGAGAAASAQHPLGTDESGRDVLARVLSGGRVTLAVGLLTMVVSLTIGGSLGSVAGFRGGWVEAVIMRLTDSAMAVPTLFVVIAIMAFLGPTVPTLITAIGLTSWMSTARVVRGEASVVRTMPFVEAARAAGCSELSIFRRHLLPHLVPTLLVAASLGVGTAILMESALSFLGLGVQPPQASWGNMLSGAMSYLFSYPWLAMTPGVLILVTVASINALADALRGHHTPLE